MPFETIPPGVCLSNNRLTVGHSDFVFSSAVCDLPNWDLYLKTLHLLPSSIFSLCPLIRKGSLDSSSISVMLTAVSQKPNSGWNIGRKPLGCKVVFNKISIRMSVRPPTRPTTLTSISPISSCWVFSGPWVVLAANIFVLLSCLLGFRLLLTCLRRSSFR